MKITEKKYIQPILLGIITLTNLILWILPSNVTRLIAKDRYVFLGRYSVERLTLLFLLIPISLLLGYIILAPTKKKLKLRIFQVVAALIVILPGLVLVDIALRFKQSARYVKTAEVYHRPPSKTYNVQIKDLPAKPVPYQKYYGSYPSYKCTLTTDVQGFRNLGELKKKYDIVTIGDSFTEGSDVTDKEIWVSILSKKSGRSIYNLGMSGTDPIDYLKAFKKFGVKLAPKTVICMIYEGNDFRASEKPEDRMKYDRLDRMTFSRWLKTYRRSSPVINTVRALLEKEFASPAIEPVIQVKQGPYQTKNGKKSPAPKVKIDENDPIAKTLGWLPIGVPQKQNTKYYNFAPKRVMGFYTTKETFLKSRGWENVRYALEHLNKICKANGIRLIVTYAPSKPNIVIPLAKDYIPAESLHAFALLRESDIPEPEKFKKEVLKSIGLIQSIIEEYCSENKIDFVDITEPLRNEAAKGNQVYFTYDQHWSPAGHKVVAKTILNFLNK